MRTNQVSTYRNSVKVEFSVKGDNFSLNVPHYKKWLGIIKYLESRGFSIGENETYKKQYSVLSKYHKIGFKGNVALLMEIGSWYIQVEFGNTKNLWKELRQAFWDNPNDDRYTKLTYLEDTAIKLEKTKLLEYLSKFNYEYVERDKKLLPADFIIDKLRVNNHIHGVVKSLDDIKNSITEDSYNYKFNSDDKNKKKITCGELKYFYDYNKRLSCGIAWHNINNMWWVIYGKTLRNIASFELFDYDISLPKRKPFTDMERVNKITNILKKKECLKEYESCIVLRDYLNKISPLLQTA